MIGHSVLQYADYIGVVVEIMIPFWIPIKTRHLISRVLKKGP